MAEDDEPEGERRALRYGIELPLGIGGGADFTRFFDCPTPGGPVASVQRYPPASAGADAVVL